MLKGREIHLSNKGKLQGMSILGDKITHTYLHQNLQAGKQIPAGNKDEVSSCRVNNLASAIDIQKINWTTSPATGTYVTLRMKKHHATIGTTRFPNDGYENDLNVNDVFNSYTRYKRACINSSANHRDVASLDASGYCLRKLVLFLIPWKLSTFSLLLLFLHSIFLIPFSARSLGLS